MRLDGHVDVTQPGQAGLEMLDQLGPRFIPQRGRVGGQAQGDRRAIAVHAQGVDLGEAHDAAARLRVGEIVQCPHYRVAGQLAVGHAQDLR